jgi:hypothetical protein
METKVPGANTSKSHLKDLHKIKMQVKEQLRAQRYAEVDKNPFVFANISKHHEFYGDTPQEHNERKRDLLENIS